MRILRILLTVVCFIGVLFLLLVAAVYALVTPDRVERNLNAFLESQFGLFLKTEEPLSIRRLPSLEVSISKAELLSARTKASVAAVSEARIEMNALAIFTASPKIHWISVKEWHAQPALADLLRAGSGAPERPWNIDGLRIENGTLPLSGFSQGFPGLSEGAVRVSALQISAQNLSEEGAEAQISGQFESKGMSGEFSAGGSLGWQEGLPRLKASRAFLTVRGLQGDKAQEVSASAELVQWEGGDLRLEAPQLVLREADGTALTATAPSAACVSGTLTVPALHASQTSETPEGPLQTTLDALFSWTPAGRSFSLQDAALSSRLTDASEKHTESLLTGEMTFDGETGRGRLKCAGAFLDVPLSFEGSLLRDRSLLEAKSADAPAEEPPLPREENAFGTGEAGGSLLQASAAPGEKIGEALRRTPVHPYCLAGKLTVGEVGAALLPDFPEAPRLLSRLDFEGDVTVSRLPGGLTGVRGHVSVDGGKLAFSDAIGTLHTGEVRLSGLLDPTGQWTLSARVRDAPAERVLAQAPVTGKLAAEISASGLWSSRTAGHMEAAFTLTEGTLKGFDVLAARRILAEEQPESIPQEALRNASSGFSEMHFRLQRETDGSLRILNGKVEAQDWTGTFEGSRDASGWLISTAQDVAASSGLPAATFYGTLALEDARPPRWSISWERALEDIRKAEGEIPFSVRNMGNKIRRYWNDFWSDVEENLPEFRLPRMPWEDEKPPEPESSPQSI